MHMAVYLFSFNFADEVKMRQVNEISKYIIYSHIHSPVHLYATNPGTKKFVLGAPRNI